MSSRAFYCVVDAMNIINSDIFKNSIIYDKFLKHYTSVTEKKAVYITKSIKESDEDLGGVEELKII